MIHRIRTAVVRQPALRHTVALYLPGTMHVSSKVDASFHRRYLHYTLAVFARRYGGVTAVKAAGGYVSEANTLVLEGIVLVSSKTSRVTSDDKQWLVKVAGIIKRDFAQEAVAVEIDGHMWFV